MSDSKAQKTWFVCVRVFIANGGGVFSFTDAESPQSTKFGLFDLPRPAMSVKLDDNSTAFSDTESTIEFPFERGNFIEWASEGHPMPRITFEVFQFFPESGEINKLYRGHLAYAETTTEKGVDVVRFACHWSSAYLRECPASAATQFCDNDFADRVCRRSLTGLVGGITTAITVVSVEGRLVTLSGVGEASIAHPLHFVNGTLRVLATDITIIGWSPLDPTKFELEEAPTKRWVGATAAIYPGCSGTLENCRLWGNERQFLAPGIATPETNPVYEGIA